jgi:5-methylcytosine-specific restriction endonuclease McrA
MPRPKQFTDEELKARKRAADALYRERNREKAAAWRDANRESIRAKQAEYRRLNQERRQAQTAAWCKANPDRVAEHRKRHYEANRDQILIDKAAQRKVSGYYAKYRAGNRATVRRNQHNYRARRRNATGRLSRNVVDRLMVLQRGRCAGCRRYLKRTGHHLDHITPLARGGPNDDGNVQLLCPRCNCAKRHADPVTWAQRNGRLL